MIVVKFLLVDLWPWWLGGIAIGLLVPLMYYFFNTALGVSTGYGNFLKIILPSTKLKWLNSETYKNKFNWRFVFIIGMILGGFLSARVSGMPITTSEMGLFTERLDYSNIFYIIWFFVGGALLGFGARLANGCTSGHSIHGLATLQKSSLVATVFFILAGVITTFLIRLILFGGN
ncbi:MAG: YeeE/YedE family protein [Actinobacteria bacterium]|nr:YeeE/YedE family protein [Actinomycetota bacterium]